jgi:phosphodiesterase/alkaline phosphatase D-like protein
MPARKNLQDLPPQYRRLRQKLSNLGWIALGSLVERDKPGQGGPRYQWSRRVGPKTVTVALSAEQFQWLKQAISNQREVWDILMQLQQLTAQYAIENIPGPPRRKRLSKKCLGLN